MKKKLLTKIMALGLAGALMLGMSTTAWADTVGSDDNGVKTGVSANMTTTDTQTKSLDVHQVVVVENEAEANAAGLFINYPAMTFKYRINKPDTTGITVTGPSLTIVEPNKVEDDTKPVTVDVKAGETTDLTLDVTNITSGKVVMNAKGQEAVTANVNILADAAKYTERGAGIYRYEIEDISTTDTNNKAALEQVGVVKGAQAPSKWYLDVYVINSDQFDCGLAIGGMVLTRTNESITASTQKESGFDKVKLTSEGKLDPTETALDAHNYVYKTYNATVKKVVAGGMGDKKNGFPFTVTVDNKSLNYTISEAGNTTASYDIAKYVVGTDYTTTTGDSATYLNAASFTKPISHNGVITVWGLSPLAKINYSEKNNTKSVYKAKIGKAGAEDASLKTEADLEANHDLAAYGDAQNVATYTNITTATSKVADPTAIVYTNTLNEISPTGVVLRFAPYVVMLGAAFFLILVAKRRREDEE